jgi:nucleoid-associated protein YgaU
MGVFDFTRNAGAEIATGESPGSPGKATASEAPATSEHASQQPEAHGRAQNKAGRQKRAAQEAGAPAQTASERRERRQRRAERRAEQKLEGKKAHHLENYVTKLGLPAEDLDIRFDQGTAYIDGTVASQADKERIVLAVGNVKGVARVDEHIKVVAGGSEAKLYTVVKGDTLSRIAQQFYGDPTKYPQIFEANRPMLQDPDLIYPGQVLRIPPE